MRVCVCVCVDVTEVGKGIMPGVVFFFKKIVFMRKLSERRFIHHGCYLHRESLHSILESVALPSQGKGGSMTCASLFFGGSRGLGEEAGEKG